MYNNYEERIELLNKQLVAEYKKNDELEKKINQAIKYIEENRYTNNEIDMVDIMNYEDFDVVLVEDLLEILKGETNE